MNITLDHYPDELCGGYYDGAKLVGTLNEGTVAEYYNPGSHGIVSFKYNAARNRLDADYSPERPLRTDQSLRDHIQRVEQRPEGGYDDLSAWARDQLEDPSR